MSFRLCLCDALRAKIQLGISDDAQPFLDVMQLQLIMSQFNRPYRRRFCAATLSAAFLSLYVVAALCLGIGVFHPGVADQTASRGEREHDHTHSHHRHQHGPTNDDGDKTPSDTLPDICDFAIQALTAPVYQFDYQPLHVLSHPHVTANAGGSGGVFAISLVRFCFGMDAATPWRADCVTDEIERLI